MKKKSALALSAVMALLLVVLASAMVLTGCNHEHNVLKWKTIKEPTCTTEGMRRGACVDCGAVIEEAVAPVEDNHLFGAWEVTVAPSYNRDGAGEAVRVCTENSEHIQKETLPKLTSTHTGYEDFEIFKEPTVVEEGRLSATYYSKTYDDYISFTINIPKKDYDAESVEDAVLLGSSNKDLIRSGYGQIDIGWNPDGESSPADFTYVFGENYIHTYYTGDQRSIWVSLTSKGEIFGIEQRVELDGSKTIKEYTTASESDLEGYYYKIQRAGRDFYGAEGLLYNAYLWGKKNTNNDFEEGINRNSKGEIESYWFSFGYYNVPQYFCQIVCNFTLTESGAIRYIRLSTNTFSRVPGTDDTNEDNQFGVRYNEYTGNTEAYLLKASTNPIYKEFIVYNQVTKEESPEEPEHEYTETAFQISSFDVTYKGKVVGEEYDAKKTPSFKAGGDNSVLLEVKNIYPSTAKLEYDPITVYRITDTGRRVKLDFSPDKDPVWYSGSSRITLYSYLAGEIKLAFVTQSGCERIVTLNVEYIAPTTLYPSIYEYNDSGYIWKTSDSDTLSASVYVGQPLTMKSVIEASKLDYVDPSYDASIASGPEGGATISVDDSGLVNFVAEKPGTYVVEMRSNVKDGNAVARVSVTVNEAPSAKDMLSGTYNATLKKCVASIVFGEMDADGKVLATVTTNKGTEILSVWYDEENKLIVSEHADGANLNILIELNEAYKLVLANPTGFGSARERSVMYDASVDAVMMAHQQG